MLSLLFPPRYFGSEQSRLFALQKSGIITILLALAAFVITIVAFAAQLAVAIPARNRFVAASDQIQIELVRRPSRSLLYASPSRADASLGHPRRATSSGSSCRASSS